MFFTKPRKLARSASATNLTYIREADVSETVGLKRSPSWSSLSPSHMLCYTDRTADRYVPVHRMYTPVMTEWYNRTYMPYRHRETIYPYGKNLHRDEEPLRPAYYRSTRVELPFYRRPASYYPKSYLQGSQDHLNKFCSRYLKNLDFQAPYIYRNRDQDINHRWTRFAGLGSDVFVSTPVSLPHFRPACHTQRLYKMRGVVCY